MAKPKTTIRKGVNKSGKIVTTKPGKGIASKLIKAITNR